MAEEEQPPAKRMRTDDAGHDLNVIVEGETIGVHSQLLTIVSPVFKRMLNSGMTESQTKEVSLPDKKKEEFLTFMEVIQPLTDVKWTAEKAQFLARWADEYGVEALRKRCEDQLLFRKVTVASLQHAVECNLERRAERCYKVMLEKIQPYMADLAALGSAIPKEMLQRLWPAVSEAAGVGEMPVPERSMLEWLLPVMVVAINRANKVKEVEGHLESKEKELQSANFCAHKYEKELQKVKRKLVTSRMRLGLAAEEKDSN
mmetsp:Transcript_4776/g.8203  ORF Transcript_4776/g.8203 Transcript_4776/m.8203 type:complete len:259 (+) Transcript_4776:138-914(+)